MIRSVGFIFGLFLVSHCSAEYLSLDGKEWTVISHNKSVKAGAIVPGSVYSDLRRAGILKNLYQGKNDVLYRWVSYDNWTYERTFSVDSTLLSKKSVELVAHGLDTVSTVYVNDKIVGHTENQFIRYKFDVKNILKAGENRIKVAFESAPIYAKVKSQEFRKKYGYPVIPDCSDKVYRGECHWNFIRKMGSSFSWDWGPAFPTQGIWKHIGIEAYDHAIIRDIITETSPQTKNPSEWSLKVVLHIETPSENVTPFDAILNVELDDRKLKTNEKVRITPSKSGSTQMILSFDTLTAITPWFPNGVANNTQKLYKLRVKMTFPNSKEESTQVKKIGFRTIELVQDPVKPQGLTFYFKVNGIPFYAKGSNWIPAHVLMEDLSPEYIRHLLESAKQANMNMIRVWGGGIYESDLFYELADEFGIMIWQDMMFACALYPANPEFLSTVDIEIEQQISRLQHHPSIAVWAGNNENEGWVWNPYGANKTLQQRDYIELYITHIMKRIEEVDVTRPFVPSSPSNGAEEKKENYTSHNSGDTRYGDVHFYDYNRRLWDWKIFPSGKFASEYGYESYASVETLSSVVNESDFKVPLTEMMEWRQHHPGGTKSMSHQIDYYFKPPSEGGVDRFDDLVYLSQITQAMAMKTETEFYRRNRDIDHKNGNGYTMGALYWQLNDIWQAATWASIEFGGKWKVLQSYAINFFDNFLVSPYEDTNHTLKVSIVRDDYRGPVDCNLTVKVYKWSQNKPIHEFSTAVKTNSFSVAKALTKSIPELLTESKCEDRSECVLKFEATDSKQNLFSAQNFLLLADPKNSKLVKPNIKVADVQMGASIDDGKHVRQTFIISLSSESVAPFVLLDFKRGSGIKGQFLDNGFFIFDGKKSVLFESLSKISEQQIKENLIFKTVTDVQ